MSYALRPFGLIFLLIMIVMGFQVALKKPLCINSSLVYKIDKIGVSGTETIYSCNQYKKVGFSNFFSDNLPELQSRLLRIEIVLAQLQLRNKYIIQIDDTHKDQIFELLNGVRIGSDLLQTSKLEKSLISSALRHKLAFADQIVVEVLSDFLTNDDQYQNLISEAWAESFKKISFFEKRRVEKKLFEIINTNDDWSKLDSVHALNVLLDRVQNPILLGLFKKNLIKSGYLDDSEMIGHQLDLIIDVSSIKDVKIDFAELARKNQSLKTALKTDEGLFLLPSYQRVPAKLEQKIFTQNRLIWIHSGANQSRIESYAKNTERLTLIKSTAIAQSLNFRSLFEQGLKEFLALNKQLSFVQLHLPSYKLKFKELNHVADYFDFVKLKELTKSEHKVLGWTQTEWLKDMRAFKPIANYDVIQYFRIN